MTTLRALAVAAILAASTAPAAHAACVTSLVCTRQRPVAGNVYGPTCVYGSIGSSGQYQTFTC